MIGMLVIACRVAAGAADVCDVADRRYDVPDLVWPSPVGCVVALPQVVAAWAEANPGWRIVTVTCRPVEVIQDLIDQLEERRA